jgi:hypothetical protein
MAQSKERLPSDLAASLLSAARGEDPQKSFSEVFGGRGATAEAPKVPVIAEKPRPQMPPKATAPKPQSSIEEGWSRKTYRLRPDQYRTLAALEALMTSESGRRVAVSELARDAFDLLIAKHKTLLSRLNAQEKPASETAA